MLAVTGIVLRFYNDKGWRQMKRGCPRTGNTARLFVLLYAAVEIVMDSTRYDSPLMHFRILSDLNQFSAFISLAQVFAGFTVLGILIHFTRCSVRCNGFRWYHIPVWLGFFACAFVTLYAQPPQSTFIPSVKHSVSAPLKRYIICFLLSSSSTSKTSGSFWSGLTVCGSHLSLYDSENSQRQTMT